MKSLSVGNLLEATGGRLVGGDAEVKRSVTQVDTDSRKARGGSLFIPLIGERFDAHAFIEDALEQGAEGCLTDREPKTCREGKFYILVEDTTRALGALAKWYKNRFAVPVVGVTGSVGKTTTKDMIASVLSERFRVLKTDGNFNNEVGLPLTMLRLDEAYEMLVLEMGMSKPGEIEYLSSLAEPDVAVITNIGDSHIEFFGSRERILAAKSEIFLHMKPGALAILNGDDPLLRTLEGKTPGPVVWCGAGENCGCRALKMTDDGEHMSFCKVKTPTLDGQLTIPALGRHMIYPALMAVAAGEHFGLSPEELMGGVAAFSPTKMRMNVLQRGDGVTILDDAYNANPQSMRAAAEVLSGAKGSYKIAVLGDMFELGAFGPMLHTGVGEYLGRVGIDCLVAVGDLAKNIAAAAGAALVPEVHYVPTRAQAYPILEGLLRPGCTILVKASRGMAFEEIVAFLKEHTKEP